MSTVPFTVQGVTFFVRGVPRSFPREHWNRLIGPKPPDGYATDGCSLSPDYLATRPVWPACIIHDWHYTGVVSRWRADWRFLRNVYRLLAGVSIVPRFGVSLMYWWGVRSRAGGAYSGGGP